MAQTKSVREMDKFIVRLPEGMRDQIKKEAEKNHRTMNAEVVAVLEAFYAAGGVTHASGFDLPAPDSELEKRLSAVERALSQMVQDDRSYDHEMRIARLEADRR